MNHDSGNHADHDFEAADGLDAEITSLLQAGRKIEAVKRYREVHGCGLREAKEAVERVGAGGEPGEGSPALPENLRDEALQEEVLQLVTDGEFIPAVKLVNERTGLGLKESRRAVELISGEKFKGGCAAAVLLAVALPAAMAIVWW